MSQDQQYTLSEDLKKYLKAKFPVNPDLLSKIPYFDTIFPSKEVRKNLTMLSGDDGIAHIEHKTFKPGEKLIIRGQFDQMIFWVLEGHADVVIEIKKQPKVIHVTKPGECVGALGVLRGAMRTADVVAGDEGVSVIELDWAITEKNNQLAKDFYHLIALNLADKLDYAYERQMKIISNSIDILHKKMTQLIRKNKKLEKLLIQNDITFESKQVIDHEQVLNQAIANIKESLTLLEHQSNKDTLDVLEFM